MRAPAMSEKKPIRLLLVEDHRLVRAGLRALFEGSPNIEVVAEADNGREALAQIAEHRPTIVLMDISMPNLNGIDATRQIARESPGLHVIILSMHSNDEYVLQALRAGARGYILKEAAPRELEFAVEAVTRGELFLSPAISKRVIDDYLAQAAGDITPLERLTPRQREILQLIAEGKSTKQIAAVLDTSLKTVETHRASLMKRLAIHDVAGLVRYAIKHGLISPER
jgi:DNA-binding NarL/FixJ family response regulator